MAGNKKQVPCTFNIFEDGRQYTGNKRKYVLENVTAIINSPATQERIRLREATGFFGHGRRVITGKLAPSEVETVKVGDKTLIVENVPAVLTTALSIDGEGTVSHTEEFLETKPGQIAAAMHDSRVGGFSWAMGGSDGGAMSPTRLKTFYGFDYVTQPNFSDNRGYILESAGGGVAPALIAESVAAATGMDTDEARQRIEAWLNSTILEATDLRAQLDDAMAGELDLIEENAGLKAQLARITAEMKAPADVIAASIAARRAMVLEAARGSVVALSDKVLEAMARMEGPEDIAAVLETINAAARLNTSRLPLGAAPGKQTVARRLLADRDNPHGLPGVPDFDPYQ